MSHAMICVGGHKSAERRYLQTKSIDRDPKIQNGRSTTPGKELAMKKSRIAWLGLLAAAGIGCEVSNPAGLAEPLAEARGAETSADGCYWDCPPCDEAECPLCEMVCPAGEFCGNRRCEIDEVCCSDVCGLCAKPGESCERTACLQPPECMQDSDCSVAPDSCVGCDCVALASEEDLPFCPNPPMECLIDPCIGHKAVCQNQRCVMQ